ncbi:peptidase U35 [Aminobacter sp. Y103A]|uniref:phage major capsid protein n=1 Tax=Aminobacter sp. Y103A TaxID=1870862 RepID=UPI002572A420|nr:Mu-like prophage major head subunit gpT family protein [Aminobacter sp. SS-2016]BBD37479.1 peptidase U35 [Aminobacter sp. SS-2016]
MTTAPALTPNPLQGFDPLAVGLLARYSPGIVRAAFGQDAVRSNPAVGFQDVVSSLNAKVGGQARSIMAMMTSDDFVQIMRDATGVAALASYIMNYPDIMRISHETHDIEDFKPVKRVRVGLFPELKEVPEGGEVQYGTVSDKAEEYSATIFSRLIELTIQAIQNDNLGLLMLPSLRIGETLADHKARLIVNRITSNPAMSDGNAVFHADHGNLASLGSALDVNGLSDGRLAMRRQKDLDGERSVSIEPAFLVVPPELETKGEQLLATLSAANSDDVNPFSGKLRLVVESRFADPKAWYLFARPERQMSLEHGTVNGMEDPEVRSEAPIGKLAVATRVTTTFATGWLDHRGAYKNPGVE